MKIFLENKKRILERPKKGGINFKPSMPRPSQPPGAHKPKPLGGRKTELNQYFDKLTPTEQDALIGFVKKILKDKGDHYGEKAFIQRES